MQRVGKLVAHCKDGFCTVLTDAMIKLHLQQLIQKSISCYRFFTIVLKASWRNLLFSLQV